MNPRQNLVGLKFNKLTPTKIMMKYGRIYFKCLCDCGKTKEVSSGNLKSGSVKSCGCLKRKVSIQKHLIPGYTIWSSMIQRCTNKKEKSYQRYGKKGITVCERWKKFDNFLADMGPRPSPKHSIDRIDSNGNYEPLNCRWVTNSMQGFNKRLSSKNTSGFRGVQKSGKKWFATIRINQKRIYLGLYENIVDAAIARSEAEIRYFGENVTNRYEGKQNMLINNVILSGHLGSDAETKDVNGKKLTTFDFAVYQGKDKKPSWIRCNAWERTGEFCQGILKGCEVIVEGSLSTREYQAKDGTTKTSVEVRASRVHQLKAPAHKEPEDVDF